MTTDITELTQSLKAAAENATPGEWCSDDQYGIVADAGLNGNYYIASCSGPEHRQNKRFIALANPANILALVEALEKAQQQIQTHERAELTWMNALELPDDATRNDILPAIHAEKYTLRAANKRIAELELHKAALLKFIRESCYVFDGYDADISDAYIDAASSSLMPKIEAEPCHHCSDGSYSGLPGGACEHCMGTGLDNPAAELESRTVKLPDDEDGQAYGFGKWSNGKLPATAGTMTIAYCEDAWRAAFEVFASAAGIKVEAE
ncbi:ead/Ea22-like family protein [Klebsiella michiganensis]|uniref:ead/Ea22-like family protein n=1 Tax=Klebsiella michiganensis TaxID=1134687 RepID=UPI003D015E02